jgi:UDPglucose 6-dehydrogenase
VKISVIGCGYLGAVHAACMAELGHEVVGIDVDPAKVDALNAATPPIFEPGLGEALAGVLASGLLRFSTDYTDAASADVHFIAVGTPQRRGEGAADLTYVNAAVDSLLPHLRPGALVVGKSTVPVGTAQALADRVRSVQPEASLAWNPEFLREGVAVADTLHPDRIVYGVPAGAEGERARAVLDEVYAQAIAAGTPQVVTDYATAELVKVAANAFLATKISFINAMSEIADAVGADVTHLADAIGHDPRIGRTFLNAGVGFGGGCLPKDIRAFRARAEELGVGDTLGFLKEVDAINLRQRDRVVDVVAEALAVNDGDRYLGSGASSGNLVGRRIAVLGLAFKPESDDIRDSPALDVAVQLKGLGADVVCADPKAIPNAREKHPQLAYAATTEALAGAEVVVLLTEWREYRDLDPAQVGALASGRIVVDGRNVLDPVAWRAAGWTYRGLGRP